MSLSYRRIEPAPLRMVCCWCRAVTREGPLERTSGGICGPCCERLLAEFRAEHPQPDPRPR